MIEEETHEDPESTQPQTSDQNGRTSALLPHEKEWMKLGEKLCSLTNNGFPQCIGDDSNKTTDEILYNICQGLQHISSVLGPTAKNTIFEKVDELTVTLTGVSSVDIEERWKNFDLNSIRDNDDIAGVLTRNRKRRRRSEEEKNGFEQESSNAEENSRIKEVESEMDEHFGGRISYRNNVYSKVIQNIEQPILFADNQIVKQEIIDPVDGSDPIPSSSAGFSYTLMLQPVPQQTQSLPYRRQNRTKFGFTFDNGARADGVITTREMIQESLKLEAERNKNTRRPPRYAPNDVARLNISESILMYPRVVFTWGEFLLDAPTSITTYSSKFVMKALLDLESNGLLHTFDRMSITSLTPQTVFIKDTRTAYLNELDLYKIESKRYMKRLFGSVEANHTHWKPLLQQIYCFEKEHNIAITKSTKNADLMEHLVCLAILQMDAIVLKKSDINISNFLLLDKAFERLQLQNLLALIDDSNADSRQWQYQKLFIPDGLDGRLEVYGIDRTFLKTEILRDLNENGNQFVEMENRGADVHIPIVPTNLEDILMVTDPGTSLENTEVNDDGEAVEVKQEIVEEN